MDNYFKFFALGDNFDVDAFISSSSLKPSYFWRVGEPKGKRKGNSPYPTSGIEFSLGDGKSVPFLDQDDIAIAFIKEHRDELKALGEFPGVTHFTLALLYKTQFQSNVLGFTMGVSPWLMWHLLDIGCRLTHYVDLELDDSDQSA